MQTRRGADKTQDLWRRMRNVGVPLRDSLPIDPPGVAIAQDGGVHENKVFALPGGVVVGYMIWLEVVPRRSGIEINRWELKLDPPDPYFQWLSLSYEHSRHGNYIFPGGGPVYLPEDVLNDRVRCPLQRPLRGALLAFGGRPIPKQYLHGSYMELEVSAIDQHGQRYSTQVELWVDRSMERTPKPSGKPVRSSLFERDAVPAGASVHPAVRPPTSGPVNQPPTLLEGDAESGRRNVSVTPRDTPKVPGSKPTQVVVPPARLLE